jgi:hypothetical protein
MQYKHEEIDGISLLNLLYLPSSLPLNHLWRYQKGYYPESAVFSRLFRGKAPVREEGVSQPPLGETAIVWSFYRYKI